MVLKNVVLLVVFAVGIGFWVKDTVASLIDRPLVYKVRTTGKCVALSTPDGLHDLKGKCFGLPELHYEKEVGPYETYSTLKAR